MAKLVVKHIYDIMEIPTQKHLVGLGGKEGTPGLGQTYIRILDIGEVTDNMTLLPGQVRFHPILQG